MESPDNEKLYEALRIQQENIAGSTQKELDEMGYDPEKATRFRKGIEQTIEDNNFRNKFRYPVQPQKDECYVATACYGDANAPEVQILREWRDSVLSKRIVGQIFIKCYYKAGPSFAKWIIKYPRLHMHIRHAIDCFIHELIKP